MPVSLRFRLTPEPFHPELKDRVQMRPLTPPHRTNRAGRLLERRPNPTWRIRGVKKCKWPQIKAGFGWVFTTEPESPDDFGRVILDGGWLGGQLQFGSLQEELDVGFGMGVAAQDHGALIGGWQVHVAHLHGGELFQDRTWRQAGGQIAQMPAQRDGQTVGLEGNEDVGFDPLLQLMIDRAQGPIVFEVFKGRFHFRPLNVKLPQLLGGTPAGDVGAQQECPGPSPRCVRPGRIALRFS